MSSSSSDSKNQPTQRTAGEEVAIKVASGVATAVACAVIFSTTGIPIPPIGGGKG